MANADQTLFLITARGGSKGVHGKNIRPLAGKPLICYTIDTARELAGDEHICVSTDSEEIKQVVENYGLSVPFLRPADLAQDRSGSYEVMLHAIAHYREKQMDYKSLVLLQPTSPFRSAAQVKEALDIFQANTGVDMVVSVKEGKDNPYYNIFEQDAEGFLQKSKPGNYVSRQECPAVYIYNGAIYVINIASLLEKPLNQFRKVKKYVMSEESSVDIDTPLDWEFSEFLLKDRKR